MQVPKKNITLNLKGKLRILDHPQVMGIINATPDSFYAGSRNSIDKALESAEQMLLEGAMMLDIGGYSTRPDAPEVSPQEELDRVIPVIEIINKHFPEAILSIDTFRADIAKAAVEVGASIVNDVSAGEDDANMLQTVANLGVPYIMMHKRGTPQTMGKLTQYEDVVLEILNYFTNRIAAAKSAGIKDIIVDPGFGFAKTLEQNYNLLKGLDRFCILELPILVGVSRKRMIQQIIGASADESLNGTTVVNTIALLKGADILRVHDVKEAVESIKLVNFYSKQ
jgi:dihydropteroate synthase